MGATLTALTNAYRATESAKSRIGLNNNLRIGVDLIVRDLIQVGQGMPTGPDRAGAERRRGAAHSAAASAGQRLHRMAGRHDRRFRPSPSDRGAGP